MIAKAELQIDESVIKPYNLNIVSPQEYIARHKSVLKIFKNCLENSSKYCEGSPVEIIIESNSTESNLQLNFIDNGGDTKRNINHNNASSLSYVLRLKIC